MSWQSQINETGPQRYDEWESCVSHITEIKDGRYVKYDDYITLATENAALKAEVARLSTWVEIDPSEMDEVSVDHSLWRSPVDCICESVGGGEDQKVSMFHRGTEYYLLYQAKSRYLPITLPGEGK